MERHFETIVIRVFLDYRTMDRVEIISRAREGKAHLLAMSLT